MGDRASRVKQLLDYINFFLFKNVHVFWNSQNSASPDDSIRTFDYGLSIKGHASR